MKKILSLILCVVMLMTLALAANADAINMAGGCKTNVTVKKANAAAVVKDGKIGAGEYTEVDINRNIDETDMHQAWWVGDDQSVSLLDKCGEFLQNVHFYFSWDEVHGLNFAVKATLLEDPVNLAKQEDFPAGAGDEFLFQFGMQASVVKPTKYSDDIMYRGISFNTETKTPIIGDYGVNGYNDVAKNFTVGKDYYVSVNGREVVYEMSYPIAAVLEAKDRDGNIPAEDASLFMNVGVTGGSVGSGTSGCETYIVGLGDYAYCYYKWAGTDLKPATVTFTHEEIPYVVETEPAATTPAATTEPVTEIVTEIVTSHVAVTTVDEIGNVVEVTNADGSVVTEVVTEVISEVVTVAPTTTTPGQGTQSPTTGDPMIIAAVVAAISACGIVVAKKRK